MYMYRCTYSFNTLYIAGYCIVQGYLVLGKILLVPTLPYKYNKILLNMVLQGPGKKRRCTVKGIEKLVFHANFLLFIYFLIPSRLLCSKRIFNLG